ncbi:hypothetical protein BDQ17DRAFT_1355003 [Cyathus striatus]|nr:hypothetical protein BDQ17DRAFT_1355003 [Cyathus striatus]
MLMTSLCSSSRRSSQRTSFSDPHPPQSSDDDILISSHKAKINAYIILSNDEPPNVVISLTTIVFAIGSLALTTLVILPLSALRSLRKQGISDEREPLNNKTDVVLIVGASHGIGFNVLKQYASKPNTTIVAVSRHMEDLLAARAQLPSDRELKGSKTIIHLETLDIGSTDPRKPSKYGPIDKVYAIAGITAGEEAWGLDITLDMIQVNVVGITSVILAMYELMRIRRHGKILIVGSTAGLFAPANMLSYASTKAFMNTFASSLRMLALDNASALAHSKEGKVPENFSKDAKHKGNVQIILTTPGYIDTRMTKLLQAQGAHLPDFIFRPAENMAGAMVDSMEDGGEGKGWVIYPLWQAMTLFGMRALNPICEDLGRYLGWKSGAATRAKLT